MQLNKIDISGVVVTTATTTTNNVLLCMCHMCHMASFLRSVQVPVQNIMPLDHTEGTSRLAFRSTNLNKPPYRPQTSYPSCTKCKSKFVLLNSMFKMFFKTMFSVL